MGVIKYVYQSGLCLTCFSGAPSHPENPSQSDAAIRVQKHPVEPPGERGAPVSPPEPVLQVQTPTVILSKEQRAVLEMVQRRENIFFTGSAGTNTGSFSS